MTIPTTTSSSSSHPPPAAPSPSPTPIITPQTSPPTSSAGSTANHDTGAPVSIDSQPATNAAATPTKPVARPPLPDPPSVADTKFSRATDSSNAPAKQRLLHSRFPSLGRIRNARRKTSDDPIALPPASSAASQHKAHPPADPPAASSIASRSNSIRSRSRSPGHSLRSVFSTEPDTDRASVAASTPPLPSTKTPRPVDSPVGRLRSPSPASRKDTDRPLTIRSGSDNISQQPRAQPAVTGNSPVPRPANMHQTSSRLLRMTDDDRPFTRDFKDLFSTLMVSLPLTPHRVRFSKIEHTFTTDEAITNLGSLKFSQSNRMPDPKDPSRIVTTTTTTTFSMAKEMARSVCHKFLDARFVESCEGKSDFLSKSSVWQLTPKGMRVLTRFCTRNGIHQRHVNELLDSPRNMMQLVILERDAETDKINNDRAMIEVIFRRFAGEMPNVREGSGSSDTDSFADYATGLLGVRCVRSSKPSHKDCPFIFTGKAGLDWLIDCCMVVDRRECLEIANLFMMHDLINQIPEEKDLNNKRFQPIKNAHYHITERGAKLTGWNRSPSASISDEITQSKLAQNAGRDSNTNRMTVIIRDPALRLLFREFLIETHCEENLTFYLEVKGFLVDYAIAKKASPPRLDLTRENLASAYSLYNAFLAPGSPCELNIDHNLRNALAGRMTRAVGEDAEMQSSLDEVAVLFDQAQTSVFKLMASDSVPKFSRDPKYATVLRDRNLEHLLTNFDRH